jgi:hypothetical protein
MPHREPRCAVLPCRVNVQVIADPAGRLVWASAALPGSSHELTAARAHGIIEALSRQNVMTFADKAYQGARGSVRTPFKRHRYRPKLSRWQKKVNRAHGPHPRHRRTRQRHPQDLESPDQAAVQPAPRHRDRAGHPGLAPRREPGLLRMKRLCSHRPSRCRRSRSTPVPEPATCPAARCGCDHPGTRRYRYPRTSSSCDGTPSPQAHQEDVPTPCIDTQNVFLCRDPKATQRYNTGEARLLYGRADENTSVMINQGRSRSTRCRSGHW